MNTSSTYVDSKPHYNILDGLRGVAAVLVVCFHICESHSTSKLDQILNHAYLAVDFFFVLSGFVVGYAYDDRWNKMSLKEFFKRRLIRLQPMVAMGMLVGAICFYFQASEMWPMIETVPIWKMLLVMIIGMTLLPVPVSMDVRGWQEMHPLNGPGWSLLFEYIANALYALFVRKFTNTMLAILVFIAGCMLIHMSVTNGDVIGGWSITTEQLYIGFTRLLYPFFAGLLLSRISKPSSIKHSFWICSLMIVALFAAPRFGGTEHFWINGLYDAFCIILMFPLIVFIGTSGNLNGKYATKVCKFFADISYPIYITHFPLVYVYMAWVSNNNMSFREAWPISILVFVTSIVLAYACLKLYDEPLRKWLRKRFM